MVKKRETLKEKVDKIIAKRSKTSKPKKVFTESRESMILGTPEIHKKFSSKTSPKVKKIPVKKIRKRDFPTLEFKTDSDIAMDFAAKAYQRFNKIIKSIVLFGSTIKKTKVHGSDIDLILIIDDTSIKWDPELIVWYREELEKLVRQNPYKKSLHINTIKLSTWWEDLIKGDPVVVNIIRDGESLIDFGGFFEPLKYLLYSGKIKSTPEAIHSLLQRAPMHISRSKNAQLSSIEGLFWSMVDSSQAALIAAGISPPSPEHVPLHLKEAFVDTGKLKMKYVVWYRDLLILHKKIAHSNTTELKGIEIDEWQKKSKEFLKVMAELVNDIISK